MDKTDPAFSSLTLDLLPLATRYGFNTEQPSVMHIDLDSCFATIEQQANPLLRNKPMVVGAYASEKGVVLSPSIEAKRHGIKTGMRVFEAKQLFPTIIVRPPDPSKYRYIYHKFCRLYAEYTPNMIPKSIDEAVLDFKDTLALKRGLLNVGQEIKDRMKKEIGEWLSASVGISTNRSLAKLSASVGKPDGLTQIDHTNFLDVYSRIKLDDFCGIGPRMLARLQVNGVFTATDFLNASVLTLRNKVFKSIVGTYWYQRLRGYESIFDIRESARKSFSHQYALQKKTADPRELSRLLMKLCTKTGRRLRHNRFTASGVFVSLRYADGSTWHEGKQFDRQLYATSDIYLYTQRLFNKSPSGKVVTLLSCGVFALNQLEQNEQLTLFEGKERELADATDVINDEYGDFTITPAVMMDMDDIILDRIAFGKGNGLDPRDVAFKKEHRNDFME